MRDRSERDRQSELLRRPIEFPEEDARLRADSAGIGMEVDPLHRTEVDDHAAVARRVARETVATATDRDRQGRFACEGERHHHVRDLGAPRDERGTTVDRPVPDASPFVVRRMGRLDQVAAK